MIEIKQEENTIDQTKADKVGKETLKHRRDSVEYKTETMHAD